MSFALATQTPTPPLSYLEIDLGALSANVAAFRSRVGPDVAICGVVKKNAYGHGAVTVAHRLAKAGCAMLGVFAPAEADELGAGAVTTPLLLLYPLRHLTRSEGAFRAAVAGRLHLTVQDVQQLEQLEEMGRAYAMTWPVHLYVDTGMSRAGLTAAQLPDVLEKVAGMKHVVLAGVMSHLATADTDGERATEQAAVFAALIETHGGSWGKDVTVHLANTFGTLRGGVLHGATGVWSQSPQMIRPGLGLYGYGEAGLAGVEAPTVATLKPALRWVSRVISAGCYERGATVGYGATHKLRRATTLGLVPVGYGDGYPLALSNRALVRVRVGEQWHEAPVRGRVNMDQISIDLTDLVKATGLSATADLRGLEVELYASDPAAPNTVERLAALAKSHVYELLCRLPKEMTRVYLK
ncbi:MAG: alanine racemase [Algisphaera sp.]